MIFVTPLLRASSLSVAKTDFIFQFTRATFSKIKTKMMSYPHLTKATLAIINVKAV